MDIEQIVTALFNLLDDRGAFNGWGDEEIENVKKDMGDLLEALGV